MSITRPPEECRDEIGYIFLFRNLAETIEDESDPRLRQLAEEEARAAAGGLSFETQPPLEIAEGGRAVPREPPPVPEVDGAAVIEWVAVPQGDEQALEEAAREAAAAEASQQQEPAESAAGDAFDEERLARRRVVLSLRYCAPPDLVRRALETLRVERGGTALPITVEPLEGPLPDVLLDRQQLTEALSILVASAIERCGDPEKVCIGLTRTEAASEKGLHPVPYVQIEIRYPKAFITEHDLGSEGDAGSRRGYRRTDLASAEKLIEANGGRLIRSLRDAEEQTLAVLLRASR